MDKMHRELEEEDENQIPCLSHILNLLGQDLTPASIMKHIVEINKFFRNHHVPSAWLKGQLGSTRPQLSSETRWKGQLICLDSYLTNRTYYIKFIQDHPDEVDCTIRRTELQPSYCMVTVFLLLRSCFMAACYLS